MSKEKAVAVQEQPKGLVLSQDEMDENEPTIGSLIKLPRVFIGQKSSPFVEEKNADIGDFYDSMSKSVICKAGSKLKIVPLMVKQILVKYKKVGKRYEYVSHENLTVKNQNTEWEQKEGELEVRYRPEVQCFFLSVEELEKGGLILPYIFTFKGASMPAAGKPLYTYATMLKNQGLPIYGQIFEISNSKQEKDGNTFQVAHTSKPLGLVPEKDHAMILEWVKTLREMRNVEVSAEVSEEEVPASQNGTSF